jgi:hypothetical protein
MAFIHPGTHRCCALEGPPGKRSTSGCQYDAWPGIRALSNLYPGFSAIVHLPDSNARASRSSPLSPGFNVVIFKKPPASARTAAFRWVGFLAAKKIGVVSVEDGNSRRGGGSGKSRGPIESD